MRPSQDTFGFDIFDLGGFTRPSVEDWEAKQRKEQADREARERRDRERFERERAEYRARQSAGGYQSPQAVLGVQPGASRKDIRAAWVRLCKQHHPDAGGDPETMKRVNRAWQDLKGQMR